MTDKLIGGLFARARKAKERRYVASTRDVGRLMRLFHGTIEALETAQKEQRDGFEVVDEVVGWPKLLRIRGDVRTLADLAEEDPLFGAADRYRTLRKFAPELLEALEFKAARSHDPTLSAIKLLQDLNRSGKRDVPADAPMPFRKEWKRLVTEDGQPNRRLYETAVLATLRDRLRSGDVWVERSANYRRFDSYLLPPAEVPPIAAKLGLPATADEWLARRGAELDRRLRRFGRRLRRGELEGVELRDGRLHVASVKAATPPKADAQAARIVAMLPAARITEIMHEVSRATRFAAAFTNLRTGERCDNENALLAAILADATNLGLTRMAAASHGVTRDQLIWTADACIRPETYNAGLARIIDAHHTLPIAAIWGGGTTSSSDGQFFRSAKRGEAAGDVNARYGRDPGFSFYTHLSDQFGPYSSAVMSATNHEAPYVLDGLLHHGTQLNIGTHYTDTGGASDHVFILCAMLGILFLPAPTRPARPQAGLRRACRSLSGSAAVDGTADQGRRGARALGRGGASGRLALCRGRCAFRHAEEARGVSPAEPARPGSAGVRANRAHPVYICYLESVRARCHLGWETTWRTLRGRESAGRHAFARPWPSWVDQTVRPDVVAYSYFLCGFDAFHRLGSFNRLALTWRVFGRQAVELAQGRIFDKLEEWGYRSARSDLRLRTITAQILLINRSARLQDLTDEVLQQLHGDPRLGRRRSPFHAVHRAVAGLGFASPPLLPTRGSPVPVEGAPVEWMTWVDRWFATSTLTPEVRREYRSILAKTGRWLTSDQPQIATPADWTRDTCAAWVARVTRIGIGDYAQAARRPCRSPRAAARTHLYGELHQCNPNAVT